VKSSLWQPRNGQRHSSWRAALVVAGVLAVPLAACTAPGSTSEPAVGSPARLSLGVSAAQAREGGATSFVLESTPDLALHAALPDAKYEGKTLQIRGVDPQGGVGWSYPHLQKGGAFDAILPVFGSAAARKHTTGRYTFEVVAPDHTVVAAGGATFTSSRGAPPDAGGA
jgi:hypothetical protein